MTLDKDLLDAAFMQQCTKTDNIKDRNAMEDVDMVNTGCETRLRAHFAEVAFTALIQKVDPGQSDSYTRINKVADIARQAANRMIIELRKDLPKKGAF